MNLLQLLGAVEIGLIYAFVAFGVFFTFRVINFPDLTVDGSFPLGAAIAAIMTIKGYNLFFSLFASLIVGCVAGYVTGLLNVKGKIMNLLAGILTMTALYSINLRIMGQPNIAIAVENNPLEGTYLIWILFLIVIISYFILIWFLNTQIGLAIRATGINEKASQAAGVNLGKMKLLTLALSNGLVSIGGAIFALSQGFADISMGTGTIIIGLASVIIGEKIFKAKAVIWALFSCILGSIAYRICIALALNADFLALNASDVNLITAIIVASALILPKVGNPIKYIR
jgi:putative ABC transport system permease protein